MRVESRDATGSGVVSNGTRVSPLDVAPTVAVVGLCAALLVLALREPGITAWALVRVAAVVVFAIWMPGRLVLSALRVEVRGLESLALALVVGTIASSLVYAGLVLVGLPAWTIAIWALGTTSVTTVRFRQTRLRTRRTVPLLRTEHALLTAIVAAGLLALASLPYYWANVVETDTGALHVVPIDDVVLHVSLGRELTEEVPPGVPFLSGTSLAYHSGADVVGAMVASLAGVSVADATLRFVPSLFLLMAALATFVFARWWLRSGIGAALTTALVLFGEDFSFMAGVPHGESSIWSVTYFGAPATYSLYYVNPMLAALAILMAAFLTLGRWLAGGVSAWLFAAGFLVASLWVYKVFVGQLLLGALVVVTVIEAVRRTGRASRTVIVVVVGGLLTVPLALFTLLATESAELTSIGVGPRPYVSRALDATGVSVDVPGIPDDVTIATAGLALFLLGNLGMRLVAVPALVSERLRLPAPPSMRMVLWTFVILGTLLTLTTRISLAHDPGGSYDNAIWFYTAAKFALWVLAVEVVVVLGARRRALAFVLAGLMLVLSIPSTIQFVERMRATVAPLDVAAADLRLLRDLDERCSGETVVLADPALVRAMLLVTDCETPAVGYDDVYSRSLLSASDLDQRVTDVAIFWRRWQQGSCDAVFVERYGVSYVIAEAGAAPAHCGLDPVVRVNRDGPHATFGTSSRLHAR